MPYKPGTYDLHQARRHAMNALAASSEFEKELTRAEKRLGELRKHLRQFNYSLIALDPPDPPRAPVLSAPCEVA